MMYIHTSTALVDASAPKVMPFFGISALCSSSNSSSSSGSSVTSVRCKLDQLHCLHATSTSVTEETTHSSTKPRVCASSVVMQCFETLPIQRSLVQQQQALTSMMPKLPIAA
jgi:hypothetical protein